MSYITPVEEKKEEELAWSTWYLSELLQWNKLGLLPIREDTDIENYCSFHGSYEIANWFKDVVVLVHGPAGCVTSFGSTRAYPGVSRKYKPMSISANLEQKDVIYGAREKLVKALIKIDETLNPIW